jgi:Chitobiase/beta-hexosaminidase C-terminal domain
MRTLLVVLILAVSASFAQAQDAAAQAAQQQAIQQSVLNSQLAQQNAQQAMQQAQQAAQISQQAQQLAAQSDPTPVCCSIAGKPKFSLKPGSYASSKTVKITDSTRGAIIFYTTDGWTPTTASNRYMGPITISSTTNLQAIAVFPYYGPYGQGYGRSLVVSAQYNITSPAATPSSPQNPPPQSAEAVPSAANGPLTLAQGTPVPLTFGADVSSKTASVGNQIPLTLSDDLEVGNVVVVPKGTPTVALVTQVDKTGIGGGPGDITFQVDSLTVNGSIIKLRGFATREGEAKPPNAAVLIPVVGPFTVFKHGTDAEIKPGTPFTAYVDADTSLPPAK